MLTFQKELGQLAERTNCLQVRMAPGHLIGTDRDQKGWCSGSAYAKCENTQGTARRRLDMDTTTLLIIVLVVLLVGGGGWYGRGRWY